MLFHLLRMHLYSAPVDPVRYIILLYLPCHTDLDGPFNIILYGLFVYVSWSFDACDAYVVNAWCLFCMLPYAFYDYCYRYLGNLFLSLSNIDMYAYCYCWLSGAHYVGLCFCRSVCLLLCLRSVPDAMRPKYFHFCPVYMFLLFVYYRRCFCVFRYILDFCRSPWVYARCYCFLVHVFLYYANLLTAIVLLLFSAW